jgi:hypothetical protein
METASILLIAGCLAGGVAGAVVSTWGLRVRLYNLEVALAEVQTKLLSKVRQEASHERWKKADIIEEARKLAAAAQGHVSTKNPWDF